ncbi:hypothetical protein D3C84_1006570 [compost metagenome]
MLGRQRGAALGDGLLHLAQALVQLALHDHVVVDDGDHSVDGADLGVHEAAEEEGAQQQRAQTIRELGLHVHGNLECLYPGSFRSHCLRRRRGP